MSSVFTRKMDSKSSCAKNNSFLRTNFLEILSYAFQAELFTILLSYQLTIKRVCGAAAGDES